jgi:hypothetical protein
MDGVMHFIWLTLLCSEHLVVVPSGERPTRANSCPLEEADESGRGSIVWFNQSTSFQTAELSHATVKETRAAGNPTHTPFKDHVLQGGFPVHEQ